MSLSIVLGGVTLGHLFFGGAEAVLFHGWAMIELLRTDNPVLMSALKAALADAGIEAFEFDGPIADMYGAVFPRRLMVHEDDLDAAREVAAGVAPDEFPAGGFSRA